MAKIKFPEKLKSLLEDDDLYAPIRELADRVATILSDNKLIFFPNYTDHGIEHINAVLRSMVELIPDEVWELSKPNKEPSLLTPQDAAIIIGSVLLHDIAMHLTVDGFRELIAADTRFKPVDWFKEDQEDHTADRPWPDLWDDFCREARRFSDRELTNIIGLEEVRNDWKFTGLPETDGTWDENLRLVIGEFLRRHHARLAHEIAIYGFPGLNAGHNADEFPAMGSQDSEITSLADLIGLTARSHGMSLRVCKAYLDAHYEGDLQPLGSSVLYPMALLRVADFLQLDRKRAPAILLQLRQPQSPVSVDEWHKHKAVEHIGPSKDPRGVMFRISKKITHAVYLQIEEMLKQLQLEMDHASAVLDECYGTQTAKYLDRLGLAFRRVHSNLNTPAYRKQLPFVPKRTGFSADPNLLGLLVQPLYGDHPGVGIRELIQNSVDAVRELEAWCEKRKIDINTLDRYDQEPDVLIEYREQKEGVFDVHVTDKGIGMTADTINNFFLRAGASFRNSPQWTKEHLGDDGKPRVVRSGRFGIGAFAIFLLGTEFTMQTRHIDAPTSEGIEIRGNQEDAEVEIKHKRNLPFGTRIVIPASSISGCIDIDAKGPNERAIANTVLWYVWDKPTVFQKIRAHRKTMVLKSAYEIPSQPNENDPDWATMMLPGYEAVNWTFASAPDLVCNGLVVRSPSAAAMPGKTKDYRYMYDGFSMPNISVVDAAGELPLQTQRYSLLTEELPFKDDLRADVIRSFLAHAVVHCPLISSSLETALSRQWHYPLLRYHGIVLDHSRSLLETPVLCWGVTRTHALPFDPELFGLLGKSRVLIWGELRGDGTIEGFSRSLAPGGLEILSRDHVIVHKSCRYSDTKTLTCRADKKSQDNKSVAIGRLLRKLCDLCSVSNVNEGGNAISVVSDGALDFVDIVAGLGGDITGVDSNESVDDATGYCRYTFGTKSSLVKLLLNANLSLMKDLSSKGYGASYVASLEGMVPKCETRSLLAHLWLKYLGEKAIPLDPDERAVMVEEASKHPELKRHIDKWQRMTPQGEVLR